MSTIAPLEGAHLAGLRAVFFAPVAALASVPDTDEGGLALLGDLVLASGTGWAQLPGVIYTASLDVDAVATVHGPGHDHELSAFFGGDAPAAAAQFQKMQGRRFVLLYRDFDGLTRLVGDQRGGLEFSYKLATGTKPGERKGYKWTFKGRTAGPALFYSGVMPAEMGPAPVPAGQGGTVEVYSAGGRLLATVPAGRRLILKSDFQLNMEIR